MSHILVVEDDRDIAELLRHYLIRAGHTVEVLDSGADVLPCIRVRLPDLLVLDLMLPVVHGFDICRALRSNEPTSQLPILMVTARAEEADRVMGLEVGADDYVVKPFSPRELVARVGALLRRARRPSVVQTEPFPLEYGPITLDRSRHRVSDGSREVTLTAKEFLLLECFMRHRGEVLSRDRLLSDVWGYQYTGGTRTVDVHVRRLREKLPLLTSALITVTQFGYQLSEIPGTRARDGGP